MRVLGKLSRDNDGLKWEKEREMKTIEHEGKTYEVLTLDRISEITHAKLAGGKVRQCVLRGHDNKFVEWQHPSNCGAYINDFEDLGIQPLRLVPKEPVTFEATFARESTGYWYPCHHLDDGIAYKGKVQRKFRCVEIVEEGT